MQFAGVPPGAGSAYGSPYQPDQYNYNYNPGQQQFQAFRAPPYNQQYHPPGYQAPQQQSNSNYQPQPNYQQPAYPQASYTAK